MLERFIKQLHAELRLEAESLKFEGDAFTLNLEDGIHISLRENPNSGITLYTAVSTMPDKGREEFLLKAMSANLFGRETGGNVLGLDDQGNKIVLLGFLSLQVNYREFHDLLEDFVNYAVAWRDETAEFIEQQVTK